MATQIEIETEIRDLIARFSHLPDEQYREALMQMIERAQIAFDTLEEDERE